MDHRLVSLGFRGRQSDAVRVFQSTYRRGEFGGTGKLKVDGVLGPRTSKALTHCVENGGRVAEHFRYVEFQCSCGGAYSSCRGVLITRDLVRMLSWLRRVHYKKGLRVVSAYRCVGRNAAVGGASSSQHLTGMAVDLEQLLPRNTRLPMYVGGVGYQGDTGLIRHLDVRPRINGEVTSWPY